MIFITSIVFAIVITAFITYKCCDHEFSSSWQLIKYTGNSVEPKDIYICKRCNNKEDINYCYCPNCGAKMTNGINMHWYSSEIDLSE